MASQELVARTKTIVAPADELEMTLRVAHRRGRLLTDPATIRPYFRADGTAIVKVSMLVPAPARRAPSAWRRWCDWNTTAASIVKALLFGLALTALGVSLLVAVALMIWSVLTPAAVGVAVGVLVLAFVVATLAVNSGGHGHPDGYGFHWTKCK